MNILKELPFLSGSTASSSSRRLAEIIWDERAGPVLILNLAERRLGLALFCHRRPERSFKILGHVFPVCSRCTGLVLGFVGFIGLVLLNLHVPPLFAFAFMLPLAIDGITQLIHLRESVNGLRFLTGFAFTVGLMFLAVKP